MTKRAQLIVLATVMVLAMASFAIARLGPSSLAFVVGLPALFISGWAFVGHLATFDDDAPGGFSNPERLSVIWKRSLLGIVLKAGLLGLVSFLVLSGQ